MILLCGGFFLPYYRLKVMESLQPSMYFLTPIIVPLMWGLRKFVRTSKNIWKTLVFRGGVGNMQQYHRYTQYANVPFAGEQFA